MLVRELLDKFRLSLKLHEFILDAEIEGEYDSYSIEHYDGHIFYNLKMNFMKLKYLKLLI